MTEQVYLALYKGRKRGWKPAALLARLSDWLTRKLTRGIYSHCEIATLRDDGSYFCLSSSIRDGGVRCKIMSLSPEKWDLIRLDVTEEEHYQITLFFYQNKGKKYDFWGALGVVFKFSQAKNRYFCSEFVAAALGLNKPEQYSPNSLARLFKGNK